MSPLFYRGPPGTSAGGPSRGSCTTMISICAKTRAGSLLEGCNQMIASIPRSGCDFGSFYGVVTTCRVCHAVFSRPRRSTIRIPAARSEETRGRTQCFGRFSAERPCFSWQGFPRSNALRAAGIGANADAFTNFSAGKTVSTVVHCATVLHVVLGALQCRVTVLLRAFRAVTRCRRSRNRTTRCRSARPSPTGAGLTARPRRRTLQDFGGRA